jgi:alkylhydroperoxidase family enzyme
MTEDEIAALDSDWAAFTPAERAAFAFCRKFTYEPHRLHDADIDQLRKHYKDLQILEMILSMAGNNALNRWKEGVGVPQSQSGGGFGRRTANTPPADRPATPHSYLTPTSERFQNKITTVAPLQLDEQTGLPTRQTVCTRPALESRAAVEAALEACRKRTPRLPLVEESKARALLPEGWPQGPLPQWVRLLANLPGQGKGRIASQRVAEDKGDLQPLLKAQLSWIIARQDRAWYALGEAQRRLQALGQSDEQVYKLDGSWDDFPPAERALFTVARQLAASPIVLTDAEVAEALKRTSPRDVVQLINYATNRASFNRITEAAGLQLER